MKRTMTKQLRLAVTSLFLSVIGGMIFSFILINNHEKSLISFPSLGSNVQDANPIAQMTITRFGSIVGKFIDYENMTTPDIKYGESKICIASVFINYPISITNRILNHHQYAKLWGYSYFYIDNITHVSDVGSLYTPKWYKPWVILELLNSNKFDYVLWLDSDAVFMNCHIPMTFLIKNVVNLLHETHYNEDIDYSMLISPDINHMNSGVLVFKNNDWSKKLIDLWIQMYYKLEALSFPKYYPWGGDNCALVMLLNGFDPKTMQVTENEVLKYLPQNRNNEYISIVKALQYNEFLLQKSYQKYVGLIPQSFFNSFERQSNTHLILHCAGSDQCKNLINWVLPTSTCSKSNTLYLNEKHNKKTTDFDDEFLKSFCIFHSYQIQKCIDKILEIFSNIESVESVESINYHTYYGRKNINYIADDLILFILSFFATQKNPNSKLIVWIPKSFDNKIVTVENIKNILCLSNTSNNIKHRIEVKVFNINLWQKISNNYNIDNHNNIRDDSDINSHLIRFVVLYHFGGIWFDIDTILLKDFSILYDVEYLYPFSYRLQVNTAVLSFKKYQTNGSIGLLLNKLFKITIKKQKKNITLDTFAPLNLMDSINPEVEPELKILPIYLFDATWYKRDRWSNSYIMEQNDLEYPYWLPKKQSKNDSYFMFFNEKIDMPSWNKINKDIQNFLPYSMSIHYHDEVLRYNNITKGSWLDMYRKEYISRIRNQLIC